MTSFDGLHGRLKDTIQRKNTKNEEFYSACRNAGNNTEVSKNNFQIYKFKIIKSHRVK
jgi:hypothetical protein